MRKTILITGCSSGFGKALCDEFSKQNYYVIATARKIENLSDVRADMKTTLDVSDENSVRSTVNYIQSHVNKIDILVNNAGYSVRSAAEEIDMNELKNMYEVNVFGMINMMKCVLPIMRDQGGGGSIMLAPFPEE